MSEQTTEVPEAAIEAAQKEAEARLIGDNPPGTKAWHDTRRSEIGLVIEAVASILTAPLREELEEAKNWNRKHKADAEAFRATACEMEERADTAERRLEDEKRLRRAFVKQRDEAHAKLAKVTRALGPEGAAADVGAARLALATVQDSQVDGEGERQLLIDAIRLLAITHYDGEELTDLDEVGGDIWYSQDLSDRGLLSTFQLPSGEYATNLAGEARRLIQRAFMLAVGQRPAATHPESTEGGGSGVGGESDRVPPASTAVPLAEDPGAASTSTPEEAPKLAEPVAKALDDHIAKRRWRVGQIVRHRIGSEWKLIEHVGGEGGDWRAECVTSHTDGPRLGEVRTFHREYMDRSFTVVDAPTPEQPEEPTCGGSGEFPALDDTLAANNESEPCPGCPDCSTQESGGEEEGGCQKPDACEWDWWPDHCQCRSNKGKRTDAPEPTEMVKRNRVAAAEENNRREAQHREQLGFAADTIRRLEAERDSRLTKEAAGELVAKLQTLAEQSKSLLNSADDQRFEPHLRGQHVGLSWAYETAADMLDAAFGEDR